MFSQFIYVITNARIFLFLLAMLHGLWNLSSSPEIKSVPLAAEAQTLNEGSPRISLPF